jgi:hypothetical protein
MVRATAAILPFSSRMPESQSGIKTVQQQQNLIQNIRAQEAKLKAALATRNGDSTDDLLSFQPKKVGRQHYPAIVELKTAGRSDVEIAKRFGVKPVEMKMHISRAMTEFVRGEVKSNPGNAVSEARQKGLEKGQAFGESMQQAVVTSTAVADALTTIA